MNTLNDLQGTTAFLNGQKGLHDLEEELCSALKRANKPFLVLDNLFEQSEKLLQVTKCDNLAFSTTGLYAEQLKTLVDVFEKLQYVPKNVFFLTENPLFLNSECKKGHFQTYHLFGMFVE
jgi:hypothetical protein